MIFKNTCALVFSSQNSALRNSLLFVGKSNLLAEVDSLEQRGPFQLLDKVFLRNIRDLGGLAIFLQIFFHLVDNELIFFGDRRASFDGNQLVVELVRSHSAHFIEL